LRQLGFALVERNGKDWFAQPCAMLRAGRCSVYDSRPSPCRAYRCRVLGDLENGALSAEEARSRIAQATALVAVLLPDLRPGHSLPEAQSEWTERRAAGRSLSHDPEREPRARFDLAMTALNWFLDRHFRGERRKMVVLSPVAIADGAAVEEPPAPPASPPRS
jgi:Fe-S-cluster containining protein